MTPALDWRLPPSADPRRQSPVMLTLLEPYRFKRSCGVFTTLHGRKLNLAPLHACRKAGHFGVSTPQPKRSCHGYIVSLKGGRAVKLIALSDTRLRLSVNSSWGEVSANNDVCKATRKARKRGWGEPSCLSDIKDVTEMIRVVAWIAVAIGVPLESFGDHLTVFHAAVAEVRKLSSEATDIQREVWRRKKSVAPTVEDDAIKSHCESHKKQRV
jgi:hypothetical protein